MELGENADTNNRVLRNILSKITKAKMTRIWKNAVFIRKSKDHISTSCVQQVAEKDHLSMKYAMSFIVDSCKEKPKKKKVT